MSELALQLIAENKAQYERGDDSAKRLDLGTCDPTQLPKELFALYWLEELVVSNRSWDCETRKQGESENTIGENRLSAVSEEIKELKNLKRLVLVGDFFHRWQISDYIILGKLTGLQSLDLSYNQISDYT